MTPCKDAAVINYFANHPEIRPHIGGTGYLDLTVVTKDPNVGLFGEHGGFCLSWTAPRTYEIHTLIAPEGRGQWAFDFAAQSVEHMASIGAELLWTRVHPDARHTMIFTRKMGLKPCGVLESDLGDGVVAYRLFERRL